MSFSGEVKACRMHTSNIIRDLPVLIHDAVGKVHALRHAQDRRITAYRRTHLRDAVASQAIVNMVRNRVIPSSKIQTVINEWDAPSYEAFTEDGMSTWRLFNAGTHALKGTSQHDFPRRTMRLHDACDALSAKALEALAATAEEEAAAPTN